MEKIYHGISEKTQSIIYLFIIPQRGAFLCGKDIRGLGEGVRWALREADFNRPYT